MARLRWAKAREGVTTAREASELAADAVRVVRVPVGLGQIIRKLSKQAEGGDVQAARELRSWLSEVPTDDASSMSELDRKTRGAVLARLLAELEAQRSGDVGDRCSFVWNGERLVPEAEFDPLADVG